MRGEEKRFNPQLGGFFWGLVKPTWSTSAVTIRSYKVYPEILLGVFFFKLGTQVSDLDIIFFWRIQNFFLEGLPQPVMLWSARENRISSI